MVKVVLDNPVEKPTKLRRLLRALRKPLLILLVIGGLSWGAWVLWGNVRDQVAIGPDYQLDPNKIELPPTPAWIHSDIRAQVIHDAGWGPTLSLLDERLTVKIAQAFQLNPWVAKVNRVSKQQPAGVQVDLEYRRPVAMVEVSGGVLAVDGEATVLPSEDFTADDAKRYARISGIQTGPRGPVGTRWGDNGVAGGARLAAFLYESWPTLLLKKIVPQVNAPTEAPEGLNFTLITRGDRALEWGHLPGHEVTGELAATEKLARLKQQVAETGSLEQGDPLPRFMSPVHHRTAALPAPKAE
ncbi:MAG TPA: hypothetical protein VFE24_14320 [Pirellulales bacterium]|nr:hypothetical protein [Pirellulales bacterium]